MGSSQLTSFNMKRNSTRTLSITSGKGGVGKTTIAANLALQLAREGRRVLILDGDLGMANVDIMFNARTRNNIFHVLQGECAMEDVVMEVARGVSIISGGSGLFELQNLSPFEKQLLLDQVSQLGGDFDYMIVDTAPGIDANVLYLNAAVQDICVVVTPDPASLADSYALIKVLNMRYKQQKFSIICNQVKDEADGLKLFDKLDSIARRFLFVSLDYKASVPTDPILRQATRAQQLVTQSHPDAMASQAIRKLSQKFRTYEPAQECRGHMQFFWEQLIGVA